METVEKFRNKINAIDDKIIKLLNRRANLVLKISNLKKKYDLEIYQPLREKEIIERIRTKYTIYKPSDIIAIWEEIIRASKSIQELI
ncbi:MAG: chorismate mutase [Promethearchaeota archaeon]